MNVKQIINSFNEVTDVEVYRFTSKVHKLHTDYIENINWDYGEDYYENREAVTYEIMDEDDYNRTILANYSDSADFDAWYGDSDAKVLVIVIGENEDIEDVPNLKKIRVSKGISQKKLAEESGVSIRIIQHYEQGFRDINKAHADTVHKLAKTLGCIMEDLLEEA